MTVNILNWNKFDRGIFILNTLAVILKDGKVLIGRRENDPYIRELSWCFPGGRPGYEEDLEYYLQIEVEKKTGLKIKPEKVFFAKTYPENRKFTSIYYLCRVIGGVEKPGEKFKEIKWVKPEELKDYFTTSLHPMLYQIILDLVKGD